MKEPVKERIRSFFETYRLMVESTAQEHGIPPERIAPVLRAGLILWVLLGILLFLLYYWLIW